MEVTITKSLLRNMVLSYRKLLSDQEYKKRNDQLMKYLFFFSEKEKLNTIHLFLPIAKNKEPDISFILQVLWDTGVSTITSITDFKLKSMKHVLLDENAELSVNHLGIPEPSNSPEVDMLDIDGVLIPLLLADKKGNRLGYGGGFYDRFLSKTKAVKIGLSLTNPVDQITQTDEWDIPLDYLITPFNIYKFDSKI